MSFTGKILRISAGIIVALILVESAFRLTGMAISFYDTSGSASAKTDAGSGRILTLGPCFTVGVGVNQNSNYPSRLETILNKNPDHKNFTVINRGLRNKNLSFFTNRLRRLIQNFHPQIIVMNINRGVVISDENLLPAVARLLTPEARIRLQLISFFKELRVYKIAALTTQLPLLGIPTHIQEDQLFLSESDDEKNSGTLATLERTAKKAAMNPADPFLQVFLALAYERMGDYPNAEKTISKAVLLAPGHTGFKMKLYWYYCFNGKFEDALKLQQDYLKKDPAFMKMIKAQLQKYETRLRSDPEDYQAAKKLSRCHALIGDYDKASLYARQAFASNAVLRHDRAAEIFYRAAQNILAGKPYSKKEIKNQQSVFGRSYWAFEDALNQTAGHKRGDKKFISGQQAFELLLAFNLQKIKAVTEKDGIIVILENSGSSLEQQKIITETCQAAGIPLVDIFRLLESAPDSDTYFDPSMPYQFNEKGYELVAKAVSEQIRLLTPKHPGESK